jgi:hypothetical protein
VRARLLLAAVVAGAALLLPGVPGAAAASGSGSYLIRIKATPAFAGLHFKLGQQTFATDGNGIARIPVPGPGTYTISAVRQQQSMTGNRVSFSRWLDNAFTPTRTVDVTSRTTKLDAGFSVMYQVHLSYVDTHSNPIDPSAITSVTLTNSLGERQTFPGSQTDHWLLGSRVARLTNGLYETEIKYGIERVVVQGTNVVNRGQQTFLPAKGIEGPVQLLFYSAHVSAHDAFFGFPMGSGVKLIFPNGTTKRYEFESGSHVTLPALPRGEYSISVDGPGISFVRPLALSRDQEVSLEVLSYLDIGAVLTFLTVVAIGLLLIGRPHLRTLLNRPAAKALKPVRDSLRRMKGSTAGGSSQPSRGASLRSRIVSWGLPLRAATAGGSFSPAAVRWACEARRPRPLTWRGRGGAESRAPQREVPSWWVTVGANGVPQEDGSRRRWPARITTRAGALRERMLVARPWRRR